MRASECDLNRDQTKRGRALTNNRDQIELHKLLNFIESERSETQDSRSKKLLPAVTKNDDLEKHSTSRRHGH